MKYKTHYGTVFINLHFYPFLSTSFVGRNCNTCSYAIKSHDQKYCITLCILINVIETLPITINSNLHYIKGQYSESQVRQIFRVPEVLHNICNMYSRNLPNMCALALGYCIPSGLCVPIR